MLNALPLYESPVPAVVVAELNLEKSDDARYPFVVELACAIEIAFAEMERGSEADVMRLRYAVFQSVVEALRGML